MHTRLVLLAATDGLTREIFGNIPPWAKGMFYGFAVAALVVLATGVWRRGRLWQLGRSSPGKWNWRGAGRRLGTDVLLQRRMVGRPLASTAHLLLFSGFVVLTIGTALVAVEHVAASALGRHDAEPVFHQGWYYAVFEFVTDLFGLVLVAGCILFAVRRIQRPSNPGHPRYDWGVVVGLLLVGVTGFLLEGLRILREQPLQPECSFAGLVTARLLEGMGIAHRAVPSLHFAAWWFHAWLALVWIAALPFTRLLHVVAGSINLIGVERQPLGTMLPVSLEEVEESGRIGVGQVHHLQRSQLVELDACVSCGRCDDSCPAHEAGKPLSPRALVQDVRGNLNRVQPSTGKATDHGRTTVDAPLGSLPPPLHGQTVSAETLWSCTVCTACADVCPLGVQPMNLVTDMRRFLVGEGQLRGAPATALQRMQRSGNPWGLPAEDRLQWAAGLNVPLASDSSDFEILYWVGCAAAYDRRLQKVARSVVRLLQRAGVRFAVLGREERCTGEAARRMGDEFLFQELAMRNIEILEHYGVKQILTHCPHCLNSLRHDYPQFGGHYQVVHHTEYLAGLIERGQLCIPPAASAGGSLTYHDPCYLARVAGICEPPRRLLRAGELDGGQQRLVEASRNRRTTSCCGAGGGRMWFEDPAADRIGSGRIAELLATGAQTVAVACPFCLTMMTDGVAAAGGHVDIRDVAELLDATDANA